MFNFGQNIKNNIKSNVQKSNTCKSFRSSHKSCLKINNNYSQLSVAQTRDPSHGTDPSCQGGVEMSNSQVLNVKSSSKYSYLLRINQGI